MKVCLTNARDDDEDTTLWGAVCHVAGNACDDVAQPGIFSLCLQGKRIKNTEEVEQGKRHRERL
jgi:hypothetical protein